MLADPGLGWATAPCANPEAVAERAHAALVRELETWPKPGLVSLVDAGSHSDMDAATLRRSADAIRPFFAEMARLGMAGADLQALRRVGLRAEAAMMRATGGVNAHRGAIFALGLIAAAEGRHGATARRSAEARARAVADLWGAEILASPPVTGSHGSRAASRYGVGGARVEAARGFPTACAIGLPALREGRRVAPGDAHAPRVQCLFALMAELDDTNLLHRGGRAGLAHARDRARGFLRRGGVAARDWRARAEAVHRDFVSRRLSPGGSADLLAVTLFLDALERHG